MQTSLVPRELLVPPRRLGQLLAGARISQGFSLDEAAWELGPKWSSLSLLEIETGHRLATDADLRSLADFYGIVTDSLIPERSKLQLDLTEGVLSAGHHATKLGADKVHRRDVLSSYLSMVYVMRDIKPGHAVPLRLEDLDTLSIALEAPRRSIEDELRLMMVNEVGNLGRRTSRLRGRLLVPIIGVVVAVTVAGTLLLVSEDSGASELPHGPKDVAGSVVDGDSAATTGAPVDIGQATFQERLPDGTPGPVQFRD